MNYINDLNNGLASLSKWGRVTLAAVSAQSLLPIIEQFAQPLTHNACKEALSAVWQSASERDAGSGLAQLRAALETLPESGCDDSNQPTYEVMIAISVIAYAVEAIIEDSETTARDACMAAVAQYAGYDHVLTHGDQPTLIDPRRFPIPGRMESLLVQLQLCLIERLLRNELLKPEDVNQIRASAMQTALELGSALPEYARRRNWPL